MIDHNDLPMVLPAEQANRVIGDDEAIVNITWNGENGYMQQAVHYDADNNRIRAWAEEAIRTGSVPGIPADPDVNLENFEIDKYSRGAGRAINTMFIRPKVALG